MKSKKKNTVSGLVQSIAKSPKGVHSLTGAERSSENIFSTITTRPLTETQAIADALYEKDAG